MTPPPPPAPTPAQPAGAPPSDSHADSAIRAYYGEQAREHGLDPASTMPDRIVRDVELRAAEAFVRFALARRADRSRRLRVLEIGCGNGLLLETLERAFPDQLELVGVDFTPELIALARQRNLTASVSVGDVRSLAFPDAAFDALLSERVIINLLDPADQAQAWREVARVLRPDGLALAVEGFKSGLANLNAARAEFCMPPIPEPAVNNWYDDVRWRGFIEGRFEPVHADAANGLTPWNALSSHYFMTRFVHDAIRPADGAMRNTHFASFFAAALPPVGDYAPLRIMHLRRLP